MVYSLAKGAESLNGDLLVTRVSWRSKADSEAKTFLEPRHGGFVLRRSAEPHSRARLAMVMLHGWGASVRHMIWVCHL